MVERGKRPPGLCDKRFTFAYIFAAVEPGTDNAFALIMPHANTETMQEFLDRFAATIADDEHVVMVLDQAGWHGSGTLRVPSKITLVALPPYSPELNPVERVWLYLKERFLLGPAPCRLQCHRRRNLRGLDPPHRRGCPHRRECGPSAGVLDLSGGSFHQAVVHPEADVGGRSASVPSSAEFDPTRLSAQSRSASITRAVVTPRPAPR